MKSVLLALLGLALFGCGANRERDLVGRFAGKIQLHDVDLELAADKTFSLHVGTEVTGTWKLTGDQLTLTQTAINGHTPQDSSGKARTVSFTATVSADDKTLTVSPPGGDGERLTLTKS